MNRVDQMKTIQCEALELFAKKMQIMVMLLQNSEL